MTSDQDAKNATKQVPNQNQNQSQIQDHSEPDEYQEGQEVDLVIKNETDLGYKAIVNAKHWGVLYYDEVFQVLGKNQTLKGYIKKIRDDGKIDLSLYQTGHQGAEGVGARIMEMLQEAGGFLPINDKTHPDEIYSEFGVSKKKFKIALSGLYKERLISIEESGIRLVRK